MKKMIALVLTLVLSIFTPAGCADSSEPFQDKVYTPDAPVREIRLDVRDRKIEVSRSTDERVHLQYSENDTESYEISISDDQVLTMTGVYAKA